jgi:uncharacterized iron-regulated membrane protein
MSTRAWDIVHTWTSLACTLFLLVLCVTGLPLIFANEIDEALAPPPAALVVGTPLTIEQVIARAKTLYPNDVVQFVFWDEDRAGVGLGLAARPGAGLDAIKRVMFDPVTAAPIPERAPQSDVTAFLLDLHSSLTLGVGGELLLTIVALTFLASLISGIAIYAPFLRGRAFGAVRAAPARVRWIDLHNFLGVAAAAWLVIVGATGFMNALEGPLFAAWDGALMERLLTPYQGKPYPDHLVSADAALAAALHAKPGMIATSIGFPYSAFGSPRHYLIWLKGDAPLTSHFFTPVLIDAASGRLASAEPLPWYLRVLEISRPLHFGDYGGAALQVIWAGLDLLAIAILLSGLYLWFAHRSWRTPAA